MATTGTVSTTTTDSGKSTDSSTVATERHLWQIFTDENGEVQKQSVGLVKNPFETESAPEPSNGNPFTGSDLPSITTSSPASLISHESLPPPKPLRASVNGQAGGKSTKVDMAGGVVVFEADKTYTRFDNVDDDPSDDELGFPVRPQSEEHHPTTKTLIRSESDLMLPYIQSNSNIFIRTKSWWSARHIATRAAIIGTVMSLAYIIIVVIILKAFS